MFKKKTSAARGLAQTGAFATRTAPVPTASPAGSAATAALTTFAAPDLALSVGLASKRGARERNEDAASISRSHDLFAIADGIGGAPLGDIMSTACCNAAVDAYEHGATLFEAFNEANLTALDLKDLLWTHNCGVGNVSPLRTATPPERTGAAANVPDARATLPAAGAGSTILLAERRGGRLNLVWAGDTIALLLREGALRLIAAPDNVRGTNELGSALGYVEAATPLFATYDIQADDRILLCTDGVWGTLDEGRIAELLAASGNAPWIAQVMTREAAERGTDNATAIVLIAEECAGEGGGCEGGEAFGADGAPRNAPVLPDLPSIPCTPNYPTFA